MLAKFYCVEIFQGNEVYMCLLVMSLVQSAAIGLRAIGAPR